MHVFLVNFCAMFFDSVVSQSIPYKGMSSSYCASVYDKLLIYLSVLKTPSKSVIIECGYVNGIDRGEDFQQ